MIAGVAARIRIINDSFFNDNFLNFLLKKIDAVNEIKQLRKLAPKTIAAVPINILQGSFISICPMRRKIVSVNEYAKVAIQATCREKITIPKKY